MLASKILKFLNKIVYCVSNTGHSYIFAFNSCKDDKIIVQDYVIYDKMISDYIYINKSDNNALLDFNDIRYISEANQEHLEIFEKLKIYYINTGHSSFAKYIDDYQHIAVSTAVYPRHMKCVYPVLGLSGEVGEVAEKVKKIYRDKNGEFSNDDIIEIKKELGDVMWYIANISHDLGISMQDIINTNVNKILSRQKRNQISGEGDNR